MEFHYFYDTCCVFLVISQQSFLTVAFLWLLNNVKYKSAQSSFLGLLPDQYIRELCYFWRWNSREWVRTLDFICIDCQEELGHTFRNQGLSGHCFTDVTTETLLIGDRATMKISTCNFFEELYVLSLKLFWFGLGIY